MRIYKLSASGGVGSIGLGASPVQVVKSGRIKGVYFSLHGMGVLTHLYGTISVGDAAVSEDGVNIADPRNFAAASAAVTAADDRVTVNQWVPCDRPIQAGQQLMLNAKGTSDFLFDSCDIFVHVQD